MSSGYIRDTKVIASRLPRPVAAVVEGAARAEGISVSDYLYSCLEPNLPQDALAAAVRQVQHDREAAELAAQ